MPEWRRKYTAEFKNEAAKMVVQTQRPIAEIAREIHVNPGTLGNWVAGYRAEHAGEELPLSITERARFRELEKEVRELSMKRVFWGKRWSSSPRSLGESKIRADRRGEVDLLHRGEMCQWAGVSTSGYCEWRDRLVSATAIRCGHLKKIITAIFELSDETYGYRRVYAQLLRQGEQVSAEFVRELMRELGLVAC
jgi:transposase-like protein